MTVGHSSSKVSLAGYSRITPLGGRSCGIGNWMRCCGCGCAYRQYEFCGTTARCAGYADKLVGDYRDVLKLLPGTMCRRHMSHAGDYRGVQRYGDFSG